MYKTIANKKGKTMLPFSKIMLQIAFDQIDSSSFALSKND